MAQSLLIEIASDVVCPWCYIGKRRLEKALALVGGEIETRGSVERGRELDARLAREGSGEGIAFAFDRMQRTPNTAAAHRLIDLAQAQGKAEAAVSALFRAYFEEALDIGDAAVLAGIAAACGVAQWPAGADAARVAVLEEGVRELGISGVPTFIFGRKSGISGAYPPPQLAAAIRDAART
jgi:predicted DsbA family dithiol-disulfide isomerase